MGQVNYLIKIPIVIETNLGDRTGLILANNLSRGSQTDFLEVPINESVRRDLRLTKSAVMFYENTTLHPVNKDQTQEEFLYISARNVQIDRYFRDIIKFAREQDYRNTPRVSMNYHGKMHCVIA